MTTHLITGTAGFHWLHLAKRLLNRGETVVGLDNINDYYSVSLKRDRLSILSEYDSFKLVEGNYRQDEALVNSVRWRF